MKSTIFILSTSYAPFVGGAEIAIQEVCARVNDRFDVTVITSRFSRDLSASEIAGGIRVIRLGIGLRIDKWLLPLLGGIFLIRAFRHIPRNERAHALVWGFDISHGSLVAIVLKQIFPIVPFLLTVQYGYGEERIARGRLGFIGLAFRALLAHADSVTAISTDLGRIVRRYGYCGPLVIIPNGVDPEQFRNPEGIPSRERAHIVITTSRLVFKNGVDILIKAIALVRKKIPGVVCRIVGEGDERKNFEDIVRKLKLEFSVVFLGKVSYEDIAHHLHEADLFVRPSRSEGMGNSFVEALAAGIPVIGTPVGGIPDIIEDGKTGLFVKPENPADLAEKIILLLSDGSLRTSLAREGKRRVEEAFSWRHVSASYHMLIERLMAARGGILIATPLFPPDIGGPATYTAMLTQELPSCGWRVRVLWFGAVRRLPKGISHMAYWYSLMRRMRGCDVILALDPVSVGLPARIAAFIGRKTFLIKIVGDYAWEQGVGRFGVNDMLDAFLESRYGVAVELLRRIQTWVTRGADRIIVPSNYLKSIVSRWGITVAKIFVIPNAFEPERIAANKEEIRTALGINGTVVVTAGRLVAWKGIDALLEVIQNIRERIADINLVVIGDGPHRTALESKAHELGVDARVRFTGRLSHAQTLSYMKASDIFILNSGYEGFSHALLEAMGSETAVIASSSGGNAELIEHNKSGILVEYNNKKQIADALCALQAEGGAFRYHLAKNAKVSVSEFSKENMMEKTCALLARLDASTRTED